MDIPKTPSVSKGGGFSIRIFLGFLFVFLGILIFVQTFVPDLLRDIPVITGTLKYGTALGSLIGGFFMIFRKKESSNMKF